MLAYTVMKPYAGMSSPIMRVKKYTEMQEAKEEKKASGKKGYHKGLHVLAKCVGKMKFFEGFKGKVQQDLSRAHILLKPEEFISVCIIFCIIFFTLGHLLSGNIICALLAGMVGWILPVLFVKKKVKSRKKAINEQLGDAIVLISNSLKAGYSFFQSVDAVCKEMQPPISEEFAQLQREINLGTPTEQALEELVERVKSDDLDMIVTAVLIQRQVGGNLAEILDNISSTIRERVRIRGDIRTITAQGRISGIIISILPIGLGIILYLINPEHIGLLFKEKMGILILIFSLFMQMTGVYFINKIVKVDI